MARGESKPNQERNIGIALWAIFGTVCLTALFFVLLTTDACEKDASDLADPSSDPFVGATAAIQRLTNPCLSVSALHSMGWVETAAMPQSTSWKVEGLSGCGGLFIEMNSAFTPVHVHGAKSRSIQPNCSQNGNRTIFVDVCDGDTLTVDEKITGTLYSLTGVSAEAMSRSSIPLGIMLDQVRSEHILRVNGWAPSSQIYYDDAAKPPFLAPKVPNSGCIVWAVTGKQSIDAGNIASSFVTWKGRHVAGGPSTITGMIACAKDSSGDRVSELNLAVPPAGKSHQLAYRAFTPTQRVVTNTNTNTTVFAAEVITPRDKTRIVLPASVPDLGAEP